VFVEAKLDRTCSDRLLVARGGPGNKKLQAAGGKRIAGGNARVSTERLTIPTDEVFGPRQGASRP